MKVFTPDPPMVNLGQTDQFANIISIGKILTLTVLN